MSQQTDFKLEPTTELTGELRVPGDKSISHRAIMLGAIADGITEVRGFLFGADNLATLHAFQALGVKIEIYAAEGWVRLFGVGRDGLQASDQPLDMGNSGTAMRLLCGLLAGQKFNSVLVGDESLTKRPMARVVTPLTQMGAKIELSDDKTAPIHVHGGAKLHGIHYDLPMASAQVKSSILLAGLYAEGETSVIEPGVTRDHTERMLQAFDYPLKVRGQKISLSGGHSLTATTIEVPADISSAAFFMVAATVVPESCVRLQAVGINPTRVGVINILQLMGADIQLSNKRLFGEEPVADIEIRYAPLKGITIPVEQVPLSIDELPVIMIAAACATGTTRLTGAEELRVKETDRIAAMAVGLTTLGIQCEVLDDGIVITGGIFGCGTVESFGDHRIAMAFAVAACVANGTVIITDCENVQTSFPNFVELATQIGFKFT